VRDEVEAERNERGLSEDLLACELVFRLHHFYVDRLWYIHQI